MEKDKHTNENKSREHETLLQVFIRSFFRNKLGVIGLIGVIIIILVALLAPYIVEPVSGYGDFENILNPPSQAHPFGTDDMGLDIFSQVIWGTRTSLQVGFLTVLIALVIGVPIGLISGYFDNFLATIGMGLTDVFLTLPVLPLMIIMAAVIGSDIKNIALVIGLFSWPKLARITRASTLSVRNMEYITAAEGLGASNFKILYKHVLPNVSAPILVNMTIIIATAILSEAGLSFLGLGDPLTWSWGKILENAHQSGAFLSAWWYSLFPSLAIMFFVVSFNFIGMGIREALNPKLRQR